MGVTPSDTERPLSTNSLREKSKAPERLWFCDIFQFKVHKYIPFQVLIKFKSAYADYMLRVFHLPVAASDLQSTLEDF